MRDRGYYWVKFPYADWGIDKPTHWEIGSWDPVVKMWAMIGSKNVWCGHQLKEIGERIKEPE